MILISNLFASIKKSRSIRRLQRIISPPGNTVMNAFRGMADPEIQKRVSKAWDEYLDVCEADKFVNHLMKKHQLTRDDLRGLTSKYVFSGLDGWVKGHQVALSTIAYGEPLAYALEAAQKTGASDAEVAWNLLEYWNDRIPQGTLLREIGYL